MARRRLRWSLLAVSLLVFDSGRHSGQLGVAITWPWNAEEQRLEKEKEIEAKRIAAEEREKEKQRKKDEEEAMKRQQALEEQERKRKLKELAEVEIEAVKKARQAARRPLNSFEERRVRRQARSEFAGGGGLQLGQQDDWAKPLKPEVKTQLDDAVRFFSETMFTPAALIGSAALGLLFMPPAKFSFSDQTQQPYKVRF
ncbi:Reticulocyte-binding protein 2 homolog a [Durusdinium trenchii]|uniref:Reticulocyte-binding protein 2 homolog a n=1 Tax=Durusdinium trenchii TaxID=1381693 RepID=A0ABP0NU53_9DINO